MMSKAFLLLVGTVTHLLVISAPLIFVDIQSGEYLRRPTTLIYYLLMTIFCFMEAEASLHLSEGEHAPAEKVFLPYVTGICVLMIFWLCLYDYSKYLHQNTLRMTVGVLFITTGIIVRVNAIRTLNKYFVSHVSYIKNHKLITTGIYSFVRNPSELGLLFICIGATILLGSWSGFFAVVFVLFPLTIYRVHLEDRLLFLLFEKKYEMYKANTPSLFPWFIKQKVYPKII